MEGGARDRSAWYANILSASQIARRAGAVGRELAGKDLNSVCLGIGGEARISAIERAVAERPRSLWFADSEQYIGIRNEEENLVQTLQVGNQAISTNGD